MENKKNTTLGLITARGGSIRLPRKNIKEFCGIPLVAWSILQSRCSRLIDLTVLTTDDPEIAAIGRKYGAKVIMRPVMDNDITAGVPFRMAIEELENDGYIIDDILCILPTSPLKKPNDLDNLVEYYRLLKQYEDIDQMDVFSPDRETFIFKNVEEMVNNYNKPYHVTRSLADKNWNYSKLGGGWNIGKRDYLMKCWHNTSDFDTEIDKQLDENMFDKKQKIVAYSIEPWQCFETDYESYFKICELLMEEFVLKGRGMSVYTDYARNFRKIVEVDDEQKSLDFEKYVGNNNQLHTEFGGD